MDNGHTARETQNLTPRASITIGASAGASVTNTTGNLNANMGDHIENKMHFGLGGIKLYPDFIVPDAGYQGSDARSRCLEGTREAAIKKILCWKNNLNASVIGWVSGPAGSGKSTMAQTIAELCATDGTLIASFFFLRGAGGRSDFSRLITTLAFQITLSVPETKPIIEEAVQDDPTIFHQSIADQFQKLILSPMSLITAHSPTQPIVVVIDGLDECDDKQAIQNFIGILARAGNSGTLSLRWLLTSRGEDHIRRAFSDYVVGAETTSFALEDFDARKDINKYLKYRFAITIKQNPRLLQNLPLPWPSAADLDALERKSSGLFLFAFTLAEFITDGKAPPDEKLKIVLNLHAGLDPLYEQVLRAVPEIACFRAVLTTLMLVREQPSVTLLADLLQLSTRDVLHALMAIQSIIHIPTDDVTPIQLNHTSLRDFLVDENRSNDLFINPPAAHFTLAIACVKLMNMTLRQDVFPTDAAPTYAAQYWLLHLGDSRAPSQVSSDMLSVLIDFSSSEVISSGFNSLLSSVRLRESSAALAQSLMQYKKTPGSGAFVRVLQKVNIRLEVHSLIVPIFALLTDPLDPDGRLHVVRI